MHDGMFVFDSVIHMYDNSAVNVIDREMADKRFTTSLYGISSAASDGDRFKSDPRFKDSQLDIQDALRMLFEESDTDMVMAQAIPVSTYWRDGYFPIARNYALKEAVPNRVLFCGAVDPNSMSPKQVVREMERQVTELGACSFKFYQAGAEGEAWAADDREVAYPMYEKALELGVTNVQFHKGEPFGHQILSPIFQPGDLQKPARDFPELNFVIHHLGNPYVDETVSVAARFENVYLTLSAWLNNFPFAPVHSLHNLGKALRYVGEDRLLYGSEAFIFPSVQSYVEVFASIEMPEELQDGYGYPPVTRDTIEKIFGLNFARVMKIDVPSKIDEFGDLSAAGVPALSDVAR